MYRAGGEFTASEIWIIETNTTNHGSNDIILDNRLPQILVDYYENSLAICQEANARHLTRKSGKVWEAEVNYSNRTDLTAQPVDPLTDELVVTWSNLREDVAVIRDTNGLLVANSAGEPYDPPQTRRRRTAVVRLSKNLAAVPTFFLQYQDAINSDVFYVDGQRVEIGEALMDSLDIGQREFQQNQSFRKVDMVLHIRFGGDWRIVVPDRGFHKKVNNKLVPIKLNGKDPRVPVLLDGAGGVLDPQNINNTVYRTHTMNRSLPFSALAPYI